MNSTLYMYAARQALSTLKSSLTQVRHIYRDDPEIEHLCTHLLSMLNVDVHRQFENLQGHMNLAPSPRREDLDMKEVK